MIEKEDKKEVLTFVDIPLNQLFDCEDDESY